ncbi:MAG: type II toxin-antitoxin system prevent-host-death family antitoxin [Chthoniobacteraceae bacterium]
MKTATVREIRNEFAKVLRWVEDGEQVEITKRKRMVAGSGQGKGQENRMAGFEGPAGQDISKWRQRETDL